MFAGVYSSRGSVSCSDGSAESLAGTVFSMGFLRSYLREGSYHRKQTLHRSHRQATGGGWRRGRVGEAGRRERDHPLDAGIDPHDGNPPEDLLGGDAHEGQGSAVKGMSRIDDLDRVVGQIGEGNGVTYGCIVFVVSSE